MTHRHLAVLAVGIAMVAAQGGVAIAGDKQAIDIGSRRELFVDDGLIEKLDGGAQLLLHHPVPREVGLVCDKPWEGNTCCYFTIFQDGALYRMYYRGQNYSTNSGKRVYRDVACYAESKDGIQWTRPELGLFEFEGSRQNNIVWDDNVRVHNFTPFKDTNPACAPHARYKALMHWGGGLQALQSADAIHWSPLATNCVITKGDFDSQNLAFWDTVRSEYRAYWRVYRPSPGVIGGVRDIKTATSTNFLDWSKPVWLEYPGARSEQLYTSAIQPYYRAPHLFIGYPTRLLPARGEQVESLFMTSRDGRVFRRWDEALIRPGLNKDRWGNRSNYIWLGLVESQSDLPGAGNELSLYSHERYYRGPGVKIRRYTYRIDGFVSVNAPLSGGRVLTKPFIFKGTNLFLNLSTSVAGSVQVEVQDAEGRPVPDFGIADCPEIYTDAIDHVVTWKKGADVARLQGRPIRLLFILKDADLYALRFADNALDGTLQGQDINTLARAERLKKYAFFPVTLAAHANRGLKDDKAAGIVGWSNQGENDMRAMPTGDQVFAGVPFHIPAPKSVIVLYSVSATNRELPKEVKNIAVNRRANALFFLHAIAWGGAPKPFMYRVNYKDGASVEVPIAQGCQVFDWFDESIWYAENMSANGTVVGFSGDNPLHKGANVLLYEWVNPHPDKEITGVDFACVGDSFDVIPILVGITAATLR